MKTVNQSTVVYKDHMGTDLTVVNAARVSFDKESEWDYIKVEKYPGVQSGASELIEEKVLKEKDVKLIQYLASHNHWTPFGHCTATLRERVPLFVARQRFKHTVGFLYNEVSRRYVDDEPEFYWPDKWRKKNPDKKQGSYENEFINLGKISHYSDYDAGNIALSDCLNNHYENTISLYNKMLDSDVAPEQARMILPQNMMTEYYVTGSLVAWARAYKLRIDNHAQKEIQDVATQWNEIFSKLWPVSWSVLIK